MAAALTYGEKNTSVDTTLTDDLDRITMITNHPTGTTCATGVFAVSNSGA